MGLLFPASQEEIPFDPALFHHELKYKAEFERQKANKSFFAGDPNILDLRTHTGTQEENLQEQRREEEADTDDGASTSTTNEVHTVRESAVCERV